MIYNVPPKIAQIVSINAEKPFLEISKEDGGNNDPFHKSATNAENFGGIFVSVSGTSISASFTGASMPRPSMAYVPEAGPLPLIEMEHYQDAKNMEQSAEIKLKMNNRS